MIKQTICQISLYFNIYIGYIPTYVGYFISYVCAYVIAFLSLHSLWTAKKEFCYRETCLPHYAYDNKRFEFKGLLIQNNFLVSVKGKSYPFHFFCIFILHF